ncbi:3'-5' exonuclease [Vibrio viridaestus]|uniref:3'-5' exonuclease n=1 Tax=Vibrio viridaestus TaxID=2487322 RepID=A0A3N9TC17_9VIBR|nr:3'-5' exonuclease [Vibrio viridaestus]RQW61273.1 3'-5' exonuclease [Vibrio viridaestus]
MAWFQSPTQKWLNQRKLYPHESLPDYLKPMALKPELDLDTDIWQLDILALDFETTGFSAQQDRILSMGWVVIETGVIKLETARHLLINPDGHSPVSESIKIHQLLPQELSQNGISEDDAFARLCHIMQNKLLLVHGTVIEEQFFNHYIQQHYQIPPLPILWLDTLHIEKARYQLLKRSLSEHDWRLSSTRERYGLPTYTAHNALVDAIATAELFLAQMKIVFGKDPSCFGKVYDLVS